MMRTTVDIKMPYYLFQSPNGQVKEVFQHMLENHVYFENNIEWARLWTNPNYAIDSSLNIDPFSSKQFADKTGKKKGTYGNMLDLSKELSEKREKIAGIDKTKEGYFKDYFKTRKKLHPAQKKEILKKGFADNKNVSIDI